MSEELTTQPAAGPEVSAGVPLSWRQVWTSALIRPSVQTYQDLLSDPQAIPRRAYLWVVAAALISYAISMAGLALTGTSSLSAIQGIDTASVLGPSMLLILACGLPVIAVAALLGLIIGAGITQGIAGLLGGAGTYARLVYAVAAFSAPLAIVSSVIGAIPQVNCVGIALLIYQIVLWVVAIAAVNLFGWGKAIGTFVITVVAVVLIVGCITVVPLLLLGPVINNVYSNIIQNLPTPGP